MAAADCFKVAMIGTAAHRAAKKISGRIRKEGMQTVFVMEGVVYATRADGMIAAAIDESAPIIGTYGVMSKSRDIAEDIEAWRAAA